MRVLTCGDRGYDSIPVEVTEMRFLHIWIGNIDLRVGLLFRWGSFWIGAHYAANHNRLCVNLVPCITIWFVGKGGDLP